MVSINFVTVFYVWTIGQAANNICQYVWPFYTEISINIYFTVKWKIERALKKVVFKLCGCNGYPAQSGVQKGSFTQGWAHLVKLFEIIHW